MNSINPDLEFTIEMESDFENNRLPTLGFEMWSTREKIRHSYYEKGMRSQVLTQKRSSQSENQKYAILTNELNRRLMMMDEEITVQERVSKIDHFTQQLINSGYQWAQIRDVVVSSLKGFLKKEVKRKEREERKYRTSAETLEERIRKSLIENVQWYKEQKDKDIDDMEDSDKKNIGNENQRWKPMKRKRIGKNKGSLKGMGIERDKKGEEEEIMEYVRGVYFVPHTENSELA